MVKRYAITGAQGTGKTTLARELCQSCNQFVGDCELLEGIGARVTAMGFPLGSRATPDTLCAFAAEHIRREREASGQVVILDRCLLDLLAYGRVLGYESDAIGILLKELAQSSLPVLRAIFYLPIVSGIESGGQHEDPVFRKQIDNEVQLCAKELGIGIHRLSGTLEERVRHSLEIVQKECGMTNSQ